MCSLISVFTNVFSVYLLYTFLSGNISIRIIDFKQIEIMTKVSVVVFAGLFNTLNTSGFSIYPEV